MKHTLRFLVHILPLALAACAGSTRYDAARLRTEAITYYEDQIMDNLIRAKDGQLIVHVNISQIQATVTTVAGANFNGGQTLTRSATAAANAAARPSTFSINPFQRQDQLSLQAVPVNDDVFAYLPYISFLNTRNPAGNLNLSFTDPASNLLLSQYSREYLGPDVLEPLKKSAVKPAPGTYIPGALRRQGGEYYYVPAQYRKPYFQMCMALMNYGAYKSVSAIPTKESSAEKPTPGHPKKSVEEKMLLRNSSLLNQLLLK